ncbi:MAG: flagellar motor protein [Gammaproteobacteria bacterium]|nr:flagellar motor protein [Gammaproteobacteria bacterium]
MDILTLLGIIFAFTAIIGGNAMEGGHLDTLLQLTAFLIVFGGTLGAVMVQTPIKVFIHSVKILGWIFIPPKLYPATALQKIVEWSQIARKEGLLGLENIAEEEDEIFTKKCLQLLVDGNEPESIRTTMEVEISTKETFDLKGAKVYEGMGGYSPTIGIIGAVLGLIHVMNNLADPSTLGPGIAVAFVATIYGVGMANLFLLPAANKLKSLISDRCHIQEMIVEGIVAIAEGDNHRNIEAKLRGYF